MTVDKLKTCCFTGHRIIPKMGRSEIENQTLKICEELIARGYENFITGGALGYDTLAAECVLELKKKYENIKLIIAVPCKGQSDNWNARDRLIYDDILSRADEVRVLSESYTSGCMQRRNRFMVDSSSVCVAYVQRASGGTFYTVSYAVECGCEIIFAAKTEKINKALDKN